MEASRKRSQYSSQSKIIATNGHSTKSNALSNFRKAPTTKPINSKKKTNINNSSAGIVSSKQLESILSLLPNGSDSNQVEDQPSLKSIQDNAKTGQTYNASKLPPLSPRSEKIIDSIMREVARMNKDKLSEKDLLTLLSSVYLETRENLRRSRQPECTNPMDNELNQARAVETTLRSTIKTENVASSSDQPRTTVAPPVLSIGEKKRIQWEQEKAELAKLAAHNPWNRPSEPKRCSAPETSASPPQKTSQQAPEPSIAVSNSNASSSPFTPMGFAVSQQVEEQRREELRRQWKAGLDEQLRQKREQDEKFLANARGTNSSECLGGMQSSYAVPGINDTSVNQSAFLPHPSASHFSVPAGPVISPASSHEYTDHNPRHPFSRPRRFVEELYSNPADELVKQRRAEEVQKVILEQIEEKRRLKEEEKAKRMMEDRLEEERLAREREHLRLIAEQEDRARKMKQVESEMRDKLMLEGLKQAHAEAEREKRQTMLGHRSAAQDHTRASPSPEPVPEILNANMGSFHDYYNQNRGAEREISVQCSTSPNLGLTETTGCQTEPLPDPYASSHIVDKPIKSQPAHQPSTNGTRKRIVSSSKNSQSTSKPSPAATRGNPHRNNSSASSQAQRISSSRLSGSQNVAVKQANRRDSSSNHSGFAGGATYTRIPVPVSNSTAPLPARSRQSPPLSQSTRYTDRLTPTYSAVDLVRTHDVLSPNPEMHDVEPTSGYRRNSQKSVTENANQSALLQHLSEIREGLKMRKMLYESGNFDEEDLNT